MIAAPEPTALQRPQAAVAYAVLRLHRALTESPERRDPALLLAQVLADLNITVLAEPEASMDRALAEVAAANMRKVEGGVRRREDGWVGPDMAAVIRDTRVFGRQGVAR